MKYYLKENFRFFYADGQLFDEDGNVAYEYENTRLMFPQVCLFRHNDLVGSIQKRLTWFLSRYDIYHHDQYVDSIQQRFKVFENELDMESLGWTIMGDFFSWHYEIYNEYGDLIARADQEPFRWTQRFYIEIYDEDNEELILLLIMAINQFDKDMQAAGAAAAAAH